MSAAPGRSQASSHRSPQGEGVPDGAAPGRSQASSHRSPQGEGVPDGAAPGRSQASSHRRAQGEGVPDGAAPGPDAFVWPLRVYWEDTDAGGIVFYANYLKYFERARTEWLRAAGFGQQALRESDGGMFVVIEAHVRYHSPARLDDQLLVTTWLRETGRVCMTIGQQARLAGPGGKLLCDATNRIGWIASGNFKPARIPSSIVKALS